MLQDDSKTAHKKSLCSPYMTDVVTFLWKQFGEASCAIPLLGQHADLLDDLECSTRGCHELWFLCHVMFPTYFEHRCFLQLSSMVLYLQTARQNRLASHYHYKITYGPRKAVAEVSNHNEPIGKGCAALMRKSIDVRLKRVAVQAAWLSTDFDCHLIWDSLVRLSIASSDSSELVVKCCEIEANCCHLVLNLVVNWRVTQVILAVNGLRFKWLGSQLIWDSRELIVNRFEIQSFCARLPSKMKLWSSKTKLFCETSFKIEALKPKNEAFLRDFLQKWSFEAQKRSFCARLPSKMKLRTSKTKHFCETSFKNDMLTARLTSELQYVLAIFKWMLQKYCACHEKVEPRHTKSCNCHAKWSLQSNTSVTWNLQPFHGFSVGGFKHRHHKARNHCPCHAKCIVSEPLQIPHACQRFCNPHKLLRLPHILKRLEIPAPATRKALWTSKSGPRPWCFNDFDFQIVVARRRGANFADFNFQKCSDHASF